VNIFSPEAMEELARMEAEHADAPPLVEANIHDAPRNTKRGPACFDCQHCGCDPDGPYCGHEKSFAETMFGRGTNYMRTVGPCGPDGMLFTVKA
jgi:hypothetical protein